MKAEGWPFRAVADAMEVVPRIFVYNAGGNATRVLTELGVQKTMTEVSGLITVPPVR